MVPSLDLQLDNPEVSIETYYIIQYNFEYNTTKNYSTQTLTTI